MKYLYKASPVTVSKTEQCSGQNGLHFLVSREHAKLRLFYIYLFIFINLKIKTKIKVGEGVPGCKCCNVRDNRKSHALWTNVSIFR